MALGYEDFDENRIPIVMRLMKNSFSAEPIKSVGSD